MFTGNFTLPVHLIKSCRIFLFSESAVVSASKLRRTILRGEIPFIFFLELQIYAG